MLAVAIGAVAGLAHAAMGPDHLAAVSTLAAGKRRAWSVGLRWALGHALGVVAIAAAAVALQRACGIDAAAAWSERAVGVLMVLLGLWALRRSLKRRVHTHVHVHDGVEHAHAHVHLGRVGQRTHTHADGTVHAHGPEAVAIDLRTAPSHTHGHAPYAIGTLHGFGGGAHLLGIGPALAFATAADAGWYLAGFAAGTVVAMTAFAAAIGTASGAGSARRQRAMAVTCALASCAVGLWWMASA